MAVRHGYGKIAGTDALVFAYDTGDTVNSYKGRPTTNYGPADFANWGTEGDANDIAQRIATGNYYKGQPTYNCRAHSTQSYRGIDKTISGLRTAAGSSGTVTMSCMVRNNNPSSYPMYAYIGHDFGSTRTIAANSDWQKVQWTVNQSSMNNDYVEFRPYTANTSIYLEMTMPMVEVNVGNASQFVNGTRSATEGLLDLTGNSSVDLSNVSFDSNAQMTFDGTDDYIETADSSLLDLTTNMSFEFVVNVDNSQGNLYPRLIDKSSAYLIHINQEAPFGVYHNVYTSAGLRQTGTTSSIIEPNTWNHIVVTYDSQIGKIYINGELVRERDYGSPLACSTNSSPVRIGGNGDTSRPLNGLLPVTKIYNRALTASEIQANFNHYKTRFNIA